MTQLRKVRRLLGSDDIAQLRWLFLVILAMAFLEVVGIASILPFMYLVSKPEAIESNAMLQWIYATVGFSSQRSMLIWAGVAVLALFTVSTVFTAFVTWLISRTVWSISHRVSMRVLDNYARLPYEFFLRYSSSDLLKKALSDVNNFVNGVVAAGIRFVAYSLLSLAIFVLLLWATPGMALAALLVFGGAHALFHLVLHGYIRRLGEQRLAMARARFQTFSEAVTGVKAIRVQGAFPFFVDRFGVASECYSRLLPRFNLIAMLPRFAIELLAFGAIISIVVYWLVSGEEFLEKIPLLTLFALAAYRLLPALNAASTSFANLTNNLPVIDEVYEDFREDLLLQADCIDDGQSLLPFTDRLVLRDVRFRYSGTAAEVVAGIDIEIPKGSRIALVGATGSGKSTLMDIMVGLLLPVDGSFSVDGQAVTRKNTAAWRRSIAYVPQEGFLYDDTLASNIAFGVPPQLIDQSRVREAARLAQIDDFISNQLPNGYAARIGERGVRLSGGQRQRIGLARAFYRRPEVLLLDEATSALDGATEAALMEALYRAFPKVTIIMIAHRLSTVQLCDCLYLIDRGRVAASGRYEELLATNHDFRRMVERTATTNVQSSG